MFSQSFNHFQFFNLFHSIRYKSQRFTICIFLNRYPYRFSQFEVIEVKISRLKKTLVLHVFLHFIVLHYIFFLFPYSIQHIMLCFFFNTNFSGACIGCGVTFTSILKRRVGFIFALCITFFWNWNNSFFFCNFAVIEILNATLTKLCQVFFHLE